MPSHVHSRPIHALVALTSLVAACERHDATSTPAESSYLPETPPGAGRPDKCSVYEGGSNSPLVNRFPIKRLYPPQPDIKAW